MAIYSKIKVEDEDKEDFLKCFVAEHPAPVDLAGNSMDALKWWRIWNRKQNNQVYKRGKKKLMTIDDKEIVKAG